MTPMLIPEIAAGAAHEVDEVRRAALDVCDWVCEADRIAVLVPDGPVGTPDWSLNGFGISVGDGPAVGLGEGIGRWLLDGRPANVVGPGQPLTGFDGVLVMGDGSASRTDKAPGHVHPDAVSFDDSVLAAMRGGDAQALADLDQQLAQDVAAAGAPAWAWLGAQTADVLTSQLDLATDPFGVLYLVARWTVRWADPA